MSRQRAKGTRLERAVADYLAAALNDDRVDRMPLHGKGDRGDIAGVRTVMGERVTVEVKNTARLNLGVWINEVQAEKGNNDSACGVVVHKRHGKGAPGEQLVTMRLEDFAVLLGAPVHPFRPEVINEVKEKREL
jgi:hypothetical protein